MRPFRFLRRLRSRFLAWLALRAGIHFYRRGDLGRAAEMLRESLALSGASFRCHLFLGKTYLRAGRFERAREELARARFLDPHRFAMEGLPQDILIEMAQRYARTSRRTRHAAPRHANPLGPVGGAGGAGRTPTPFLVRDDFVDEDERTRFRGLPPIRYADLREVDWEQADELFE